MDGTLVERQGWLFIAYVTTSWTEPKRITYYWPLNVCFTDFRHRFSTEQEARRQIGQKMRSLGNGYFHDERGITYRLMDGGNTQPEYTEVEDVAAPKQRGRKLQLEWREGVWQKETVNGWKLA